MAFPIPYNIQTYATGPGFKTGGVGPQANVNPGGTGEIQGSPDEYMKNLFDMMRRIHGYRQTMGNYSSDGGTNVNQS